MPAAPSGDFSLFSTVDFWRMHPRAYEKRFTNDIRHTDKAKIKTAILNLGQPLFTRFYYFSMNFIIGVTSSKEWG
jgi:hypothetical protein